MRNTQRILNACGCGIAGVILGPMVMLLIAVIKGPSSTFIDYVPYSFVIPVIAFVVAIIWSEKIDEFLDD